MIHHVSIAAREPERVARVLAELMGGAVVPDESGFFAGQLDEQGTAVEVYAAGTELQPGGPSGGKFIRGATGRGFGPTHVALSVAIDPQAIERIAHREGWQCYRCDRGPFHVLELWVENETLVEVLPPEYAAEYLAFTRALGLRLAQPREL